VVGLVQSRRHSRTGLTSPPTRPRRRLGPGGLNVWRGAITDQAGVQGDRRRLAGSGLAARLSRPAPPPRAQPSTRRAGSRPGVRRACGAATQASAAPGCARATMFWPGLSGRSWRTTQPQPAPSLALGPP